MIHLHQERMRVGDFPLFVECSSFSRAALKACAVRSKTAKNDFSLENRSRLEIDHEDVLRWKSMAGRLYAKKKDSNLPFSGPYVGALSSGRAQQGRAFQRTSCPTSAQIETATTERRTPSLYSQVFWSLAASLREELQILKVKVATIPSSRGKTFASEATEKDRSSFF